jgi:2-C-methyl-D-erythritol 4-phosphate cytidylyltransferase
LNHFAIITGGGIGVRMGGAVPKQFLPLNGFPILMHSIACFASVVDTIIVTLPESYFDYWEELQEKHAFSVSHTLVAGGETRFYSVKNALNRLPHTGWVAVHDAVRPLVSPTLIQTCFAHAKKQETAVAVIPAIPVKDSLRSVSDGANHRIDRLGCFSIQTPQVFRCEILKEAYQQAYQPAFTDDASVVEALGKYKIELVEGEESNLKITSPFDLALAAFILNLKQRETQ